MALTIMEFQFDWQKMLCEKADRNKSKCPNECFMEQYIWCQIKLGFLTLFWYCIISIIQNAVIDIVTAYSINFLQILQHIPVINKSRHKGVSLAPK